MADRQAHTARHESFPLQPDKPYTATPPSEYTHPNGKRRIRILPDFVLEEIRAGVWWLLPLTVAVKPSRKGRRPNR